MKVLAKLLSQIDTWQCSNLMKCTLIWIRELQEIKRLLSQIDILHQMLIKFWPRDTLICERVLEILTLSSNSQYVLKVKIRFDCAGHRKMKKQQGSRMPARHFVLWKWSKKKLGKLKTKRRKEKCFRWSAQRPTFISEGNENTGKIRWCWFWLG